ncbi:hypothetical protein COU00_01645 [Candidatus Falkowbacteria bacterium CG10_big_fil_rev_8_21_14_0_10_43_11]|uniref:DUF559 domain-containing protein n=1 Tax=Candidatus Falkowbacteria bacterium CG10_big_fil_rev_8_21_14_0_10_43_11 TaxID=1974568 RepID=A0A2M6WMF1_9BACT|nr:MAG: hypothetical protein COU00_01645 [Candidatus Falkowbacteria bacterium CG10_big_fil_rev_8_21_14_0_10_43_11]
MRVIHNLSKQKKLRQYFRNNETKAEELLWKFLKDSQLRYKFRRQHGVKQYVLDFYCPQLKLAVEADGDSHNYQSQNQHDWVRDKFLESLGITVIRYKNEDIILRMGDVLENLKDICDNLKNRQT